MLGIANTDPVEIFVEDDRIVLKKYVSVCHFCGNSENLVEYKDKKVCRHCISEMAGI